MSLRLVSIMFPEIKLSAPEEISALNEGFNKFSHLSSVYFANITLFIGEDKLLKRKNFKSTNFEIRFHFEPGTKITKTQDNKSILIEIENSGWKFFADNHLIDIETGLYFGYKNSFVENQNISISGKTRNEDQTVGWQIIKI